ncbi:MAG: FGGY-family carbohydrate kinase [bacterium]
MQGARYVLAVDHGTTGVKTSIVSDRGEVTDTDFRATPMRFLPGGGAEQDAEDWWNALLATCKRLVQRGSVPAREIAAVCVSSTFSSTVAVDRHGDALGPSLTWMDSRGAPYVTALMKGFPGIQGYGVSKLLDWIPKTAGCPSLTGKDDIAHVLLWKNEFPDVYRSTHMFLPSKDYLNLRLTGRFAASFDSMHLFWLTDTRDIRRVHYDDGLLRKLGIDRDKLPPLCAPTDVLGTLAAAVAGEIGLDPGVKVVAGSPDHQSACIGSGAVRDYEGHVYIGTSSWVECIVPFKRTDILHAIASFPTAIPGKYQCVNEQDLAGGCLGFLAENLLFHPNRFLPARARPEDVYGTLDAVAGEVPAGSHKLIFTPWLNGERTPVDDGALRGGLHNISKTTTMDHVVRAVMEGVAYNTRWSLACVEKFVRRKLDPLHLVGGGAKSAIWCQILADVLDREIRQVRDPLCANARGAAWIAAVGLGWITFDDIPGLVRIAKTYAPRPENRAVYDELFQRFLEIHRKTKGIYRKLNPG